MIQAGLKFGTKAETLEELAKVITKSMVLPQVRFIRQEWPKGRRATKFHRLHPHARSLANNVDQYAACIEFIAVNQYRREIVSALPVEGFDGSHTIVNEKVVPRAARQDGNHGRNRPRLG